MPAKNPRISVTVKPETDALLRRLSELTGDSTSKMVGDILEQSQPVFERLVKVLEAAAMAKDQLTAKHTEGLKEAEAQVLEHFGLSMDLFEQMTDSIVSDAEAITRKTRKKRGTTTARPDEAPASPAGATAGRRPPLVTRGSGTPTDKKKTTKSISTGAIKRASKASKAKGRG